MLQHHFALRCLSSFETDRRLIVYARLCDFLLFLVLQLPLAALHARPVPLALFDQLLHCLPLLCRHTVPVRILPRRQTAEWHLVPLHLLLASQSIGQPLLAAQRLHEQLEEAVDDEGLVALSQEVEV